jgi:hypothetical protein
MDLINNEAKDKFVFVDFYQQWCRWCYVLVEDFNKISTDMIEWYGEDKVEFWKVDGGIAYNIPFYYNINQYPTIIAIKPGFGPNLGDVFRAFPRDYNNFKEWML